MVTGVGREGKGEDRVRENAASEVGLAYIMEDETIRHEHILDRSPSMRIAHSSNAAVLLLPTIAHNQTLHTSNYVPQISSEERAEPAVRSRDYEVDEHKLSIEEVASRYGTSLNVDVPEASEGLTVEEAESRLKANGSNSLTPPVTRSELIKFLVHFLDPLILCCKITGS